MKGKPRTAVVTIGEEMHSSPHTIDVRRSLAAAHQLMRRNRIRHLPVVEGKKLVGMLSIGDLHLIETLKDVDPERVAVDEAMSTDAYVVSPKEPLAEVARTMADRRLGSAIVASRGKVVGIFTTVDALALLARLLDERK
jgi:acetoin utilization protein AcuB